jgi:hypothetical protein
MARMSQLSAESMKGDADQHKIRATAAEIAADLHRWWKSCPAKLRDQSNDWLRQIPAESLTASQLLQKEGMSSLRSCMFGCVIYLNHILNPLCQEPRKAEVTEAIKEILDIAQVTPDRERTLGKSQDDDVITTVVAYPISRITDPDFFSKDLAALFFLANKLK